MGKRTRLAAITIGQSPRADMTRDMFARLPGDLEVVEYGALDPYSAQEVQRLFAPGKDDEVLVSRMRDGAQVRLAEQKLLAPLQACISRGEAEGAAAVLVLCTGDFPEFSHTVPLLLPMPLLHATARILAGTQKIAVLVPDAQQREPARLRWAESGLKAETFAASPYLGREGVAEASRQLRGRGFAFLVMDCMGYTVKMKRLSREASGLPVLLPRTLMAAVAAEFLSCAN